MAESPLRPALPARACRGAPPGPRPHDDRWRPEADAITAHRLAALAHHIALDWGLTLGEPFTLSRHSFVAPAGDDAVLKVVPAEDDESTREPEALAFWDGDGAVRLLRYDASRRALLLERARPGHDASDLTDDEAAGVALEVARRLWRRPPGSGYERVRDRVPRWLAEAGSSSLAESARSIYESLAPRDEVLVHGDFHHHNLLRHGDGWVAIDPKPMLAEREFDVVTLLWNPLGATPTRDRVARMVAAFAAQGLDAKRIRAWAVVRGAYLRHELVASLALDMEA